MGRVAYSFRVDECRRIFPRSYNLNRCSRIIRNNINAQQIEQINKKVNAKTWLNDSSNNHLIRYGLSGDKTERLYNSSDQRAKFF